MSKYSVKNLINTELTSRSKEVRLKAIEISKANGGYHYGGSFSSAEILLTIYDKLITDEDRFILSKGHACLALYCMLYEKKILSKNLREKCSSISILFSYFSGMTSS